MLLFLHLLYVTRSEKLVLQPENTFTYLIVFISFT